VRGVFAILVVAACEGTEADRVLDPQPFECPTPARRALDDCFVGYFFADCGGEGPPRLACRERGGCYWFSGSCLALGFVASECPAEDVCCYSDPDGNYPWPYPDLRFDDPFLRDKFYGLGHEAWDRTTDANLSTSIDTNLSISTTSVICTGPPPEFPESGFDPCVETHDYAGIVGDTVLLVGISIPWFAGWYPQIEIIPDGGAMRASVCARQFTDFLYQSCPDHERVCASSGSIVLSDWPTSAGNPIGLMARVDATFASGFRYQADIVILEP
jgi:hypothetical protein